MANAINTDNFPTNAAGRGRNVDDRSAPGGRHEPSATTTRHAGDQVDIERARQRLAQEVGREPAIANRGQALERLAELRAQLAAEPHAAVQAHRRADATLFEAATARPAV